MKPAFPSIGRLLNSLCLPDATFEKMVDGLAMANVADVREMNRMLYEHAAAGPAAAVSGTVSPPRVCPPVPGADASHSPETTPISTDAARVR